MLSLRKSPTPRQGWLDPPRIASLALFLLSISPFLSVDLFAQNKISAPRQSAVAKGYGGTSGAAKYLAFFENREHSVLFQLEEQTGGKIFPYKVDFTELSELRLNCMRSTSCLRSRSIRQAWLNNSRHWERQRFRNSFSISRFPSFQCIRKISEKHLVPPFCRKR